MVHSRQAGEPSGDSWLVESDIQGKGLKKWCYSGPVVPEITQITLMMFGALKAASKYVQENNVVLEIDLHSTTSFFPTICVGLTGCHPTQYTPCWKHLGT